MAATTETADRSSALVEPVADKQRCWPAALRSNGHAAAAKQFTPHKAPARHRLQASAQADGPITVNPSVTWGGTFDGTVYPGMLVGNPRRHLVAPADLAQTVTSPSWAESSAAVSDDIFSYHPVQRQRRILLHPRR